MQGANKGQSGSLDGKDLAIGIVRARFNDDITGKLAEACTAELIALGVSERHITQVIMGSSLRSPWQEEFRGSIINQVLSQTENVDVYIIGRKDV